MSHIISVERRISIENSLNDEQKNFLSRRIQNTVYDQWMQDLIDSGKIRKMNDVNDEDLYCLAGEYILVERLVADKGRPYTCDEGHKNLKRLYVLKSVNDGKFIRLGETCLKNFTQLSQDVLNALIKCFDGIDREYERILLAYSQGLWGEQKGYLTIEDLPATVRKQLELGLPLSQLQLSKNKKLIDRYNARIRIEEETRKKQEQRERVLSEMSINQKIYFHNCSEKEQSDIINYFGRTIVTMDMVASIVEELPKNIRKYIELEFPLNYVQEQVVNDLLRKCHSKSNKILKSPIDGRVMDGKQNRPNIYNSPVQNTAIQKTITYSEAIEYFEPYLNRLKDVKPLVEARCPRAWRELINLMSTSKEKGAVSKPLLKVYIKEVYDSLGWKWL